jgi:DNA-binding Lrp family transcriptional regulator
MTLDGVELALLDRWQRQFPLAERPFAVVGGSVGLAEDAAIAAFERLAKQNVLTRIGAIVRPNTVGASTLAALSVAPARIDEVASLVSAEPAVTHNYEREHELNLWFVVAGPHAGAVDATIRRIEERSGLPVLNLPLLKAYCLDTGFPLIGASHSDVRPAAAIGYEPDAADRELLAGMEDGLALTPRPYRELGDRIGLAEGEVIRRLERLIAAAIITRFGCVVRHRALGYVANAMAVWDIPDDVVDGVAARIIRNSRVTLCYRRARRLPEWPYNVFCMVHAKERADALAVIDDVNAVADAALFDQAVLFSTRCFKQRGARFSEPVEAAS